VKTPRNASVVAGGSAACAMMSALVPTGVAVTTEPRHQICASMFQRPERRFRTAVHRNREEIQMSLSLVHSRALLGLEARPVQVEVHLANGLPSFTLVVCQLQMPSRHIRHP
jgi:hypothetical protein